jgi:hypothetical protein
MAVMWIEIFMTKNVDCVVGCDAVTVLYSGDAMLLPNGGKYLQFWLEVLTAVTMKMAVFWVVEPYRLVWVYQLFRSL